MTDQLFPDPGLTPRSDLFPGQAPTTAPPTQEPSPPPSPTPGVETSVRPASDYWYDELEVSQPGDAERGYPLKLLLNGLAVAFGVLHDIVRDSDDGPGWSMVLDPVRAPRWTLPWLAQFAGVTLTEGLSEAQQRARITSPAAFDRGTADGMKSAILGTLTGSKYLFFKEQEGSPYRVTAVTRADETPNPSATLAAAKSQKPAGLVLTLTSTTARIYVEVDNGSPSYTALAATYATYDDVRGF